MIKEFHVSKNLLPRPTAAKTETIGDMTFALDNNGVITISGTASESVTFSYNLAQTYTMPTSKSQGGDAYLYLWNSTTTNGTIRFFYDDTQRDYWSMGTVNRVLTGFDNLENQTINRIEIRIPSGTSYNGTIAPMVTNDGEQATHFEPYGDTWNTKSYAKSISGAQTYTKFPIVLRTTEQSIPTWSMDGNTETSGTPSPTSPITINGCGDRTANLSPVGSFTIAAHDASQRVDIFSGTLEAGNYVVALNQDNAISGSTRNTLQVTVGGTTYYNSSSANYHNQSGQQKMTFTVTETGNVDVKYWGNDLNENCSYSNITFNAGSEVINEPYGYKIPIPNGQTTTNIYLGSVQSNRQIKKLVLDGTESAYTYTYNNTNGVALRNVLETNYNHADGLCTHYPVATSNVGDSLWIGASNANLYFVGILDIMGYTTYNQFMQYLADQYSNGTPVTVWYVLATPQTGIVNEPLMKIGTYADTLSNAAQIPTTSGLNTIDVDTNVKPSEMSLTYDGYKLCKGQRYSRTENLCDGIFIQGNINADTGDEQDSTKRVRQYYDVVAGETYSFSSNQFIRTVYGYSGTTPVSNIRNYYATQPQIDTFTIPSGINRIGICLMNSDGTNIAPSNVSQAMLNVGQPMPYQPYLDWE